MLMEIIRKRKKWMGHLRIMGKWQVAGIKRWMVGVEVIGLLQKGLTRTHLVEMHVMLAL